MHNKSSLNLKIFCLLSFVLSNWCCAQPLHNEKDLPKLDVSSLLAQEEISLKKEMEYQNKAIQIFKNFHQRYVEYTTWIYRMELIKVNNGEIGNKISKASGNIKTAYLIPIFLLEGIRKMKEFNKVISSDVNYYMWQLEKDMSEILRQIISLKIYITTFTNYFNKDMNIDTESWKGINGAKRAKDWLIKATSKREDYKRIQSTILEIERKISKYIQS